MRGKCINQKEKPKYKKDNIKNKNNKNLKTINTHMFKETNLIKLMFQKILAKTSMLN